MGYIFKLHQAIGDDVSIDKDVGISKLIDISRVVLSGSTFGEIRNAITGEHYRVLLRGIDHSRVAAIYTNNPEYISIGNAGTASQTTPQITTLTANAGWEYRTRGYLIPASSNILMTSSIYWGATAVNGGNYTYTPTSDPAKQDVRYIPVTYTISDGAFAGEYYGIIIDNQVSSTSDVLLVQKAAWGAESEPLPQKPTGGAGGFGNRDNSTDITINIGDKPSGFLSGILGNGFNMYYVPNYSDLVRACYYSLSGVNNVSEFVNNTAALFLSPSTYIVSAVQIPMPPSAFGAGVLQHKIRMGGLLNFNVDCYPLGAFWADSDTFTYQFNGMYFDNFMDFEPYTQINLLLPYVGIVPLRPSECVGGSVSVKYRFEALTGKCIAFVYTTDRNGRETGYYQYSGDAGYSLPWVGNNGGGSQMMHSAASAAIALGTGKATADTALGIVSDFGGFMSKDTRPKMQGGFGVNTGIFGADDIVLFITRAQNAMPDHYYEVHGYQTATGGTVGDYSGYTEILYIDLEHCPATDAEKAEIESILRGGVYL